MYVAAFALVFRTNVAYNRYWESCTQAAFMAAKWGDTVALVLGFDMFNKPPQNNDARTHRQRRLWQALIIHRASLLHALSMQYLRRDDDVRRPQPPCLPTPSGARPIGPMPTPRSRRVALAAPVQGRALPPHPLARRAADVHVVGAKHAAAPDEPRTVTQRHVPARAAELDGRWRTSGRTLVFLRSKR